MATERNRGFISDEEQRQLANAVIAIGGVGGDGGAVAVSLARMGVRHFRLADPDVFEVENLNRQVCCTMSTLGKNKAEVVAAYIKNINPSIEVVVYPAGITLANVESFLDGADLLIDETEFTLPELAVSLAQQARHRNIPNLQVINVGFGVQVTTYDATSTYTLEKRLGFAEGVTPQLAKGHNVPLVNWLAEIPSYMDASMFEKVANGKLSAPSVVTGVNAAASIASAQALLLLTAGSNRPSPVFAPHVLCVDAMTGTARRVRHSAMRMRLALVAMTLRNRFGRIPKVDV